MKYVIRTLIAILFLPFWVLFFTVLFLSIVVSILQYIPYYIWKGELLEDEDTVTGRFVNITFNTLEYASEKLKEKNLL